MHNAKQFSLRVKRRFDLAFACIGLALLAPLFVVLAAAIKMDSSGPILFRQVRIGRFGKAFRIHKFRTMKVDPGWRGPQITSASDSRVTKVGAFIRKYKLDELPQLIDVVKGDMSLVGPRPEVPRYVNQYDEQLRGAILSMPPGITGRASLEYRNESHILGASPNPEREYIERILPNKLRCDAIYITEWSLWGDVVLILRTLKAIFN